MKRSDLLHLLNLHVPADENERTMTNRMRDFVESNEDCFSRSLASGHITGSAWIVDPSLSRTLLVLHKRFGRWLQPGGHCDGDADVLSTALREAREETGVAEIHSLHSAVFDIDIHPIPPKGQEPAHEHFDVRFLFEADPEHTLTVSSESRAVEWADLAEIRRYTDEESVLRLVRKTMNMRRP